MQRYIELRRAVVALLVVGATLATAACDSDHSSASPTHTPEATSTATPAPTGVPTTSSTPDPGSPTSSPSNDASGPGAAHTLFGSTEFGVQFQYQTAPDGFVLEEFREPEPGMVVAWSMVRESAIAASPDNGFGPRGITIEVFDPGTPTPTAEDWVRSNGRSNFAMGPGEVRPETVGATPGVRYEWFGLHNAVSVVVERHGWIWMFTGTYHLEPSEVSADFDALLASTAFTRCAPLAAVEASGGADRADCE